MKNIVLSLFICITTLCNAQENNYQADENNSLANLNYSKVMLEDREIIKQMLNNL